MESRELVTIKIRSSLSSPSWEDKEHEYFPRAHFGFRRENHSLFTMALKNNRPAFAVLSLQTVIGSLTGLQWKPLPRPETFAGVRISHFFYRWVNCEQDRLFPKGLKTPTKRVRFFFSRKSVLQSLMFTTAVCLMFSHIFVRGGWDGLQLFASHPHPDPPPGFSRQDQRHLGVDLGCMESDACENLGPS